MQLTGHVFAPRSSERSAAQFQYEPDSQWSLITQHGKSSYSVDEVTFSDPVGDRPIRISLPDGRVFVTPRTSELDAWLAPTRRWIFGLDWLESNWLAWGSGIVLCALMVLGCFQYALPWVSHKAAQTIPTPWALQLGDKVLTALDHYYQPSKLSTARQAEIRRRVEHLLPDLPAMPTKINIEFRSDKDHANAFALPGGTIVLLDGVVNLAKTEQQLDAIVLHELGHIYHRHMMTRLVESSIISVAVALMTGEASGVIDNMAGAGVFLLANRRSRSDELQADEFARQALIHLYGSANSLGEMFSLLKQQGGLEVPEWLSTHPKMDERIERSH